MAHRYRFGDILIDQESYRLWQGGVPLAVEPKSLKVLIFLVQNRGRLVERRELLSAVWGDAFVTDHVLNRSIGQLRKVLGDDAKEPRYIETVPTLGYRFIAAVEVDPSDVPVAAPAGFKSASDGEPCEQQALSTAPKTLDPAGPSEPAETVSDQETAKLVTPERGDAPSRRIWLSPKLWFYGIGLVAALTAMLFLLKKPVAPGPLGSTQITFSADIKERPIFTDGSRLYFEHRGEPSEMAVSGGVIAPMRALQPGMHLRDISSDGSKVLAWTAGSKEKPEPGSPWGAPMPDGSLSGPGSLWIASMPGGAARKLVDQAGTPAVWSPDGHSIVSFDGSWIYTMDETGGGKIKLWEAPGPVTDIFFSPDGKQFCVTVEMDSVSRLWILRSDGTHAHLLQVEWPDNWDVRNGRWTPDGRHFIFRSDGEGRQNLYEVVKPDWFHFWRQPTAVRITTNQIEILASVPSRSTEGLFVLGRLDQGAMQVFEPRTQTMVPFLNGFSAKAFAISPDGQWMAYSQYPTDYLWKSRLDGSAAVQLTNLPAYWQHWSPDGKWLVYSDNRKLYRVSADGGPSEKLIATGDDEIGPTWSPDGKSVIFNNHWDFVHESDGLSVLDLATRKVSNLASSQSFYVASWSPDGRYLAALANNPSRMVLYTAKSRTWSVLKVFDHPWGIYTWSRDSKSIYMALMQDHRGIFRLGVPGGAWDKIVGLENIDSRPSEAFVSVTTDNQPVMMSHTGVAQFYLLRWPR